jgi:hypothetical protein
VQVRVLIPDHRGHSRVMWLLPFAAAADPLRLTFKLSVSSLACLIEEHSGESCSWDALGGGLRHTVYDD